MSKIEDSSLKEGKSIRQSTGMFVLIRVRDSSMQNNTKDEAESQHNFSFVNSYMTGSLEQFSQD